MAKAGRLTPDVGPGARDALAAGAGEPSACYSASRDRHGRSNVEERAQDEGALVHAWMRNGEPRSREATPRIEQQVQVEHAWRVTPVAWRAPAPVAMLDGGKLPQHRAGSKRRAQHR